MAKVKVDINGYGPVMNDEQFFTESQYATYKVLKQNLYTFLKGTCINIPNWQKHMFDDLIVADLSAADEETSLEWKIETIKQEAIEAIKNLKGWTIWKDIITMATTLCMVL